MDILPPQRGWTGCFPGEAISHLLNERENDVEPIVVVHKPAGQSIGEKVTDLIRSTSFQRSGATGYFRRPSATVSRLHHKQNTGHAG